MLEVNYFTDTDKTIIECDCGYNQVSEGELSGCVKCPYCGSKSCGE